MHFLYPAFEFLFGFSGACLPAKAGRTLVHFIFIQPHPPSPSPKERGSGTAYNNQSSSLPHFHLFFIEQ
jgi:hypothetical protein